MIEAVRELRKEGMDTLDLSGIFRDKTADIYVDFFHFNGIGDGILATAIADAIRHPAGASD